MYCCIVDLRGFVAVEGTVLRILIFVRVVNIVRCDAGITELSGERASHQKRN